MFARLRFTISRFVGRRSLASLVLSITLLLLFVAGAQAAGLQFQEPEPPTLTGIDQLIAFLLEFKELAGAATFIAALVNVGKTFGLLPDGAAPKASLILNLVGFVALVLLRVFAPDVPISEVDATAAVIATALVTLLGLAVQFGLTRFIHEKALKGLPWIGKSHSQEKAALLLQPAVKV